MNYKIKYIKTNLQNQVSLFGFINNVATFTKYPGNGLGEFRFVHNGSGSSASSTIGTIYDDFNF